jgi:RNA polymerase sigma-70 factor, ECF subfamily
MADERADVQPDRQPALIPLEHAERDFDAFYRRELTSMVALAAAIAGVDRAEEIAQEAMIRAHREWGRVAHYERPGAWLRRVTTNLAISAQRSRLRERRALARVSGRRQLDAPPPEVDGFWALVRQLPPQQAAAVALYYLHDLPITDLADALDCTEGTAKAHLYKARATLAARLARQPDGQEGAR